MTEEFETKKRTRRPKENMHSSIEIKAGTTTFRPDSKKKKPPRLETAKDIAGHYFCKINALSEILKQAFPLNVRMWHVDKLFPYSVHGELLIDEPRLPYNIDQCLEKAKILKEHGVKYIVLKNGTDPIACTDEELSMTVFGEVIE